MHRNHSEQTEDTRAHVSARLAWSGLVAGALLLAAGPATAAGGACSRTASLQHAACKAEVKDDQLERRASCVNLGDPADQKECEAEAKADAKEEKTACKEQRVARLEICDAIGQEPYDPDFDPANFEDDFVSPGVMSPYLPLTIGNTWDYESADEATHIEVQDATKAIEGVTCLVVRDEVSEDGEVAESTDDWFGLALDGDVWYCGEESKDFEFFEGDDPEAPELVSIEGSFKAGRDGAKPGLLLPATPMVGMVYRQEYFLGDAEDVAEVIAVDYVYGDDADLDQLVPQALADAFCGDGCFVTREWTPLEPDVSERKYYAPGIGMFLETNVEEGEVNQLVDCSFDARCDTLPAP